MAWVLELEGWVLDFSAVLLDRTWAYVVFDERLDSEVDC